MKNMLQVISELNRLAAVCGGHKNLFHVLVKGSDIAADCGGPEALLEILGWKVNGAATRETPRETGGHTLARETARETLPPERKPRSSLENVCLRIIGSKNGINLKDLHDAALADGYHSNSNDFMNMVLQAVGRLRQKNKITRTHDGLYEKLK